MVTFFTQVKYFKNQTLFITKTNIFFGNPANIKLFLLQERKATQCVSIVELIQKIVKLLILFGGSIKIGSEMCLHYI